MINVCSFKFCSSKYHLVSFYLSLFLSGQSPPNHKPHFLLQPTSNSSPTPIRQTQKPKSSYHTLILLDYLSSLQSPTPHCLPLTLLVLKHPGTTHASPSAHACHYPKTMKTRNSLHLSTRPPSISSPKLLPKSN